MVMIDVLHSLFSMPLLQGETILKTINVSDNFTSRQCSTT